MSTLICTHVYMETTFIVVVPLFKTLITLYKIHTYICVYTMFEGVNVKSLSLILISYIKLMLLNVLN